MAITGYHKPSLAVLNRGHLKKYYPVLEYALYQQLPIPPTMHVIHSKDFISKPLFLPYPLNTNM
jgi:hypothetical protein